MTPHTVICMCVGYRMVTGHKGLKKSQSSKNEEAGQMVDTHMHGDPEAAR